MAGKKNTSKRNGRHDAPAKEKRPHLVPVPMMNAPITIQQHDNGESSRARSATTKSTKSDYVRPCSGKKSRDVLHEESDYSADTDSSTGSENSVDAERDGVENMVDEMYLEDYLGSNEYGGVRRTSTYRAKRGYDLPRLRIPGESPKTVTIFENILRPDDVPRWFTPVIRFRFHKFWEKFEHTTDEEFRIPIWMAFKEWYIVPDEIHDAVYKLFLEQLHRCYKNLVAKMKRKALERAELTVPSKRLLRYPPHFLMNRLRLWKQWVAHWCSEKQLKISQINSKNRKALNGGIGTHVGGSKSGSRMTSQIIDITGEPPSISTRLKLQYGKRDSEGNLTSEMISPAAGMILKEWEGAVRETYGPEENVDENKDTQLYLNIPSVRSRKKKGRIPGYGTTKHAYLKLGLSSQGSNSGMESEAGRVDLLKQVDVLNNLVSQQKEKFEQQEAKINGFNKILKFLGDKMGCELPSLDVILESQSDDTLVAATPNPDVASDATLGDPDAAR